MLKMNEVRDMDENAIRAKINELRLSTHDLRMTKVTTTLKETHKLTENKKDIARLLTVLSEKNRK